MENPLKTSVHRTWKGLKTVSSGIIALKILSRNPRSLNPI